jgi:hypothetical protein
MKRYVRAVLGGFLAILAAFGWTVAIGFLVLGKNGDSVVGVKNGLALWILLFLIFTAGFYLSFRAAYSSKILSWGITGKRFSAHHAAAQKVYVLTSDLTP